MKSTAQAHSAKKKCKRKGKRKKRCRRRTTTGTGPAAPAPVPAPAPAPKPTRTNEEQLLISRGHWWEYDYDGDGLCYLYGYSEATGGYLVGSRTRYFTNFFTGNCNSIPSGATTGFNWSASSGALRNFFVGGYTEVIGLGQLTPDEFLPISRASTGGSGWWSCRSPNFYFYGFYSC